VADPEGPPQRRGTRAGQGQASTPDDRSSGSVSIETAIQVLREQQFTGPLPHPEILRGYEDVVPGAAERLLTMAERNSQHRRDMERIVVEGGSRRAWAGLVLGFIIAVLFLIVSAALIINGYEVAGTILGTVDVVGLVTVFVVGRVEQRQEREEKAHPTDQP
jgi:uncharacterized membrane protein